MNDLLEKLGAGALLAWIALPVLALTVRRSRNWEARSRQRALTWVLGLALAMVTVPFLRDLIGPRASVTLPSAWMAKVASAPLIGASAQSVQGGPSWTPLALAGAAWLALVALGMLRAGLRAARLVLLCARAAPPAAATLAQVDAAARKMRLRPPYVLCTEEQAVPFVTGLFRPTLVLPRRLMSALDGVAAELALRHELVHLARMDHWRAAGIALLRLPLWPHPVAARLHAELVLAREEAVDREVAPASPHAYSQLLVDAAHYRAEQVVAMASGDLARRIARLTDPRELPRGRLVAALACFGVVAGAVLAFPRAAAARPEPPVDLTTFLPQDGQVELDLREGQQLTLSEPGMRRVAVGDPTIADVKSLPGDRLQVLGGTAGATTLLVWGSAGAPRSYEVIVSDNTPDPLSNALPSQINLTVGDELFLPLPAIKRVAVGDPGIVDIAANDDGLHLLPVSAGQTTLLVWGHGGRHQSLLSVRE